MKLWEISEKLEALINASLDEETGELAPEALEEIESWELDLETKALNTGKVMAGFESEAEAVMQTIRQLQARRKTLLNNAEGLRNYLEQHVPEGQDFKDGKGFALKWSRGAVEADVDALPAQYVRVKEVREARKSEIQEAKKANPSVLIPGARIVRHLKAKVG